MGNPGRYKQEGYAVSTGYMNEKKAVYIIPQIDKSKLLYAIICYYLICAKYCFVFLC